MKHRFIAVAAASAIVLLGGAGAASAAVTPSPVPSVSASQPPVLATSAPTAAYKLISGPGQDGTAGPGISVPSTAPDTGGLVAAGVATQAEAKQFLAAHPHAVRPAAGGNMCSTECGYEYSSSFAPVTGTETSGSVNMSVTQQGLEESTDHAWLANHSLENYVVAGTCAAGNTGCTASPLIEIHMMNGQQYCGASFQTCFVSYLWKNGNEQFADTKTNWVTVNQPDNGTYHPGGVTGNVTLGYQLDNTNSRLDVVANGTILGYFPYSYWGQSTFGPITEESVQTEAFQAAGNYGTEPYVSMDDTLSSFTDSNGHTLPAPAVSSDYSTSGVTSGGWTVSGGRAPSDTTTSWPIELDQDQLGCIGDEGGVVANGNPIIIANCSSWRSYEAFRYDPTSKEVWYQNGGTGGYCLDDPSNSTGNNVSLILEQCSGLTGEKFNVSVIGNSYKLYKMANGVNCINDPTSANLLGNPVQLYACNSTAAQQNDTYAY